MKRREFTVHVYYEPNVCHLDWHGSIDGEEESTTVSQSLPSDVLRGIANYLDDEGGE